MVGSFLNVCIYRLPRDLSLLFPGSACTACRRPIAWYDNIPILSFLWLRGSCRRCGASISWRYPLVEFVTGGLFLALFYWELVLGRQPDRGIFVVHAMVLFLLIAVSGIDFEFRIIPDEITKPVICFGPLLSLLYPSLQPVLGWGGFTGFARMSGPWEALGASLLGVLVGGGMVYGLGLAGEAIFKKEAMGGGDVKLMAMLGGLLGWHPVFLTFWIAPFLGLVYGLYSWAVTKDHYIPYGPFLGLAAVLVIFFQGPVCIWWLGWV
jgi:leader peptidase (prepilin peptidase)/N-methyltransferase